LFQSLLLSTNVEVASPDYELDLFVEQ
jgi:hypothetical protein